MTQLGWVAPREASPIAGEPLGTLWVVSPREDHFRQADANALWELGKFNTLKVLRADDDLRTALAA